MRVLFVCLGNICRSPTAEGVLRQKLRDAGLAKRIEVASAGTGAGTRAKRRTCAASGRPNAAAMTCRRNVRSKSVLPTSIAMT